MDLCLILDNSEMVREEDFNLAKNAMGDLISSLSKEISQCKKILAHLQLLILL